jgi:hypothetical protein
MMLNIVFNFMREVSVIHPTHAPTCSHETLASGPIVAVQRCRHCGTFALQIGAITVRLEPAAAESFEATLAEALSVLRRREGERGPLEGVPRTAPRGLA